MGIIRVGCSLRHRIPQKKREKKEKKELLIKSMEHWPTHRRRCTSATGVASSTVPQPAATSKQARNTTHHARSGHRCSLKPWHPRGKSGDELVGQLATQFVGGWRINLEQGGVKGMPLTGHPRHDAGSHVYGGVGGFELAPTMRAFVRNDDGSMCVDRFEVV